MAATDRSGSQLALGLTVLIGAAVLVDAVFTGRNPWDVVLAVVRGQAPPPKSSPGSSSVAPSPATGTATQLAADAGNAAKIAYMISWALSQQGKPYKVGPGRYGPDYYDCSGFTYAAYKSIGITIDNLSQTQAGDGISVPISPQNVKAGDLIIMEGAAPPNDHVALAISGTQMISAPHTGAVVGISSIPYSGTGSSKITTIRRILP